MESVYFPTILGFNLLSIPVHKNRLFLNCIAAKFLKIFVVSEVMLATLEFGRRSTEK